MHGFCLLFFSLLGNGTIGLYTWLVDLSISDSSGLEWLGLDEVDACVWLCWMELDGVDTWLSTFFSNLNVWMTLHWFNDWSQPNELVENSYDSLLADWARYPFASHSVDWLIGSFEPLVSVLFAWANLGSSCTFHVSLKISHSPFKLRILEGRLWSLVEKVLLIIW